MKLSVLVITAREKAGFEDLVRSLQKEAVLLDKHGIELELIFVDRNWESRGDLYELAMAQIDAIDFQHIKDSPVHAGPCPAGARNAGVLASSGDWIVSIDDLTIFHEGTLLRQWELFLAGFDAAIATFDVIDDSETIIDGPGADSRLHDPSRGDGHWAANHFYGMNMSFSRLAWERIGGFDECFDGVYGQEDCDFGLRLWRAGCSIAWSEEAKVLCYRGSGHTSTHKALFTDPSDVPTSYVAGVPKWRNDALIQWNTVVGKVIADRSHSND